MDEGVQVGDQAEHDRAQAGIVGGGEAGEHLGQEGGSGCVGAWGGRHAEGFLLLLAAVVTMAARLLQWRLGYPAGGPAV